MNIFRPDLGPHLAEAVRFAARPAPRDATELLPAEAGSDTGALSLSKKRI